MLQYWPNSGFGVISLVSLNYSKATTWQYRDPFLVPKWPLRNFPLNETVKTDQKLFKSGLIGPILRILSFNILGLGWFFAYRSKTLQSMNQNLVVKWPVDRIRKSQSLKTKKKSFEIKDWKQCRNYIPPTPSPSRSFETKKIYL